MNLILRLALNFICKKNSKFLSFTSIVSVLGIAFGVAAFLVVITILNSFQSELKSIISSTNPNIIIYSQSGINNPVQFEKRLESIIPVPIHSMSRFIYQESVMGLGRQTSAVYIRAIEGTASSSKDSLQKYINPVDALKTLNAISPLIDQTRNTKDDTSTPELLPHVILGSGLAESLNAKIGDTVTLMTFAHENGRVGIRYNKLFVTGFISTGLSEYDKKQVLMNFEDGVKLFGVESWASGIEIRLQNLDDALAVSQELNSLLPYNVIAWQQIDRGLFEQIERDGTAIKLIVLIISFVAGFNIIVTLSLTVMDRAPHISLLRALGATKSIIIRVFVCSGFVLGVLGSLTGVLTGLLILKIFAGIPLGDFQKFYYLKKIPVQIDSYLILIALCTSILLSFFGALYPAWKASRVSPMQGLSQTF